MTKKGNFCARHGDRILALSAAVPCDTPKPLCTGLFSRFFSFARTLVELERGGVC